MCPGYSPSCFIAAFLPPAVQDVTIERIMGEIVILSCTNNNPPTLATEIRWTQDGDVLQRLLLTEDENTVTYTTEADESGVYQCQVLSADETVLVVNIALTVDEGINCIRVMMCMLCLLFFAVNCRSHSSSAMQA